MMRRSGARDYETNRVRTRVDGCQLNGSGHSQRQRCDNACEGW
jgi:hypothetical protein